MVGRLRSEDLLPFPPGLTEINLNCTGVKWLPELPEGLTTLTLAKSKIKKLPRLPSTLE